MSLNQSGADRAKDLQAAQGASTSPSSRYANPRELLTDATLTKSQKQSLLEEWEEDIRLTLVAAEEGMNGFDGVQLREVLSAKRLLSGDDAARPDTPSKS